ncbi:Type 1 glutamine amidotransferase-like domain-containing protein [Lactobacillus sp. ESL0791]|uniref:Type 1 glutamine amidotransferase-like domain-containing protein n=1 Tax=Lactobacillus sp. ESL0791 TaxID=2983234 RepID=UPI0023F6C3CB|nr:Type 1 glutamine amidotransferase-like domain-containing protein [Lactobacillus sp. ESL0791]MDF7639634.1 Type 1 glutamine amidotransferase-like domain-containing protein [Lactobacillus sp. ESL0791]
MTKKMFLCSMFHNVRKLLPQFAGELTGKRVTYIPTASIAETGGRFMSRTEGRALAKLGLTVDELELSKATPAEAADKLKHNDMIYVAGGNTFFLLQELKRTGADKVIVQEVNAGKLYIGESAGSVITAPDIKYIGLMDSAAKAPELTDYSALHLLDFYVLPHYISFPYKKQARHIYEVYANKIPLKPISNNQVVLVNGEQIKIAEK